MLRYDTQTKPGLVALYDIRPGKMERVHSYNPGARTGHRMDRKSHSTYPKISKHCTTATHTEAVSQACLTVSENSGFSVSKNQAGPLGGLLSLSLTTKGSWIPGCTFREGRQLSHQPSDASTHC